MAITLMTTTGTEQDVREALGLAPDSSVTPDAAPGPITGRVDVLPSAPAEGGPSPEAVASDTPPPAVNAPPEEPVPDSEFDEDGEPLTERAARSSRSKMKTIHKLRVRAREAETRAARLEGELAVLRTSPPTGPAPTPISATPPPLQVVADPDEPKEADHPTYESWIAAVADHRARKAVREELQRQAEQAVKTRQQVDHVERIRAFAADHPDYDDVINNPDLLVSAAMQHFLITREEGPAIAYALGKDPARCKHIASLPADQAFEELGLLRAELRRGATKSQARPATQPPVTTAPPPPTPVRGGTVVPSVSLEEFASTIDPGSPKTSEWIRRRNEQLARQGRH